MPCGAEGAGGAVDVGHDIDGGYARRLVHRHMVVGDVSALCADEEVGGADAGGCLPQADHDGAGVAQAEAFVAEAGIVAADHVKEDAVACLITRAACLATPVLRAQAPVGAVVGGLSPVGGAVVFEVEAYQVDAHLRLEFLQAACHFEEYGHAGGTVVGGHDGLAVAAAVGVGVGPWTAVPVGGEHHALGGVGVVACDDVAAAPRLAVPCGGVKRLVFYTQAVGGHAGGDIVGTGGVGGRAGHAGPQVALAVDVHHGRVGGKLHRRELHLWLGGAVLRGGGLAAAGEGHRQGDGKEGKEKATCHRFSVSYIIGMSYAICRAALFVEDVCGVAVVVVALVVVVPALLETGILHPAHHADEVSGPQASQMLCRQALGHEALGEDEIVGRRLQTDDAAVAVEVGAYADVVDAGHVDHVHDVAHGVVDGGLAAVGEEAVVEGALCHAAGCRQRSQLVVGEVARVVAEGACRRVGADDGLRAQCHGVVEGLFGGVREVHHHPHAVHLADHLTSEGAQSAVLAVGAACGVAEVVVAVVAQGEIDHALTAEAGHVAQVAAQSIAVLDAHHDGLLAGGLGAEQVFGAVGQGDAGGGLHLTAYLLQQVVGAQRGLGQRLVAAFALRQIGHHDGGIQTAGGHGVHIDAHVGVACGEVGAPAVEHGGVAVGVEGVDVAVQAAHGAKTLTLLDEMSEQGRHGAVALSSVAFGVPLHADDALALGALHGFCHAVGTACRDVQVGSGLVHGLVVEGVDGEAFAHEACDERAGLGAHAVGRDVARGVLAVLHRGGVAEGHADVLVHAAAQRHGQHLHAAADAEDGNVAVVGQPHQKEFGIVALGRDGMELGDGVLAGKEGVDVAAAREHEAVDAVEQGGEQHAVIGDGDDEGDATGQFDAAGVAKGQFVTLAAHVGGDADDGARLVVGKLRSDGLHFVVDMKSVDKHDGKKRGSIVVSAYRQAHLSPRDAVPFPRHDVAGRAARSRGERRWGSKGPWCRYGAAKDCRRGCRSGSGGVGCAETTPCARAPPAQTAP